MDKKLLGLLILFFLSFGIFSTIVVFNKPLTQFTRAKEEMLPSGVKSLIFAWPLTVAADGKNEASITVFIRTSTDKPVTNKVVSLSSSLGDLKISTATTNNEGKATFQLSSQNKGTAEIEAIVDNSIKLSQKISIKFE